MEAHKAGWRNEKHADAMDVRPCKAYAYPVFGSLPVAAVDTGLVPQGAGTDLVEKTRDRPLGCAGRIERVLDWAKVRGYRARRKPGAVARPSRKLLPRA